MQVCLSIMLLVVAAAGDAEEAQLVQVRQEMQQAVQECNGSPPCETRVRGEYMKRIRAIVKAYNAAVPNPPEPPADTCDCEELAAQVDELKDEIVKLTVEAERLKGMGKLISSEGVGKAKWGISLKQLKRLYKVKNNGENYVRSTKVAGMSAYQAYWFTQDKLTLSVTLIADTYSNKNEYVNRFNALRELLAQKYGDPERVWADWSQDAYRNMPEHIGFAIANGHVTFLGVWRTEKTGIELSLSGNNRQISLRIRYHSIELEDLQKAADQAEHLADL